MTPLESHIEWMFAAAVRNEIRRMDNPYYLLELPPSDLPTFLKQWEERDPGGAYTIAGAPQIQCGEHRVDFLFAGYCFEEANALVAVECDGHAFHERNKEQAARDKSRDRDLAMMGICILRFTGSEIYRDANACVQQVFQLLEERTRAAFDRRYPRESLNVAQQIEEASQVIHSHD
jgi:very-short-patch-repair endonuclease